jgi:RNase H-like domain found in reverse transcriptase
MSEAEQRHEVHDQALPVLAIVLAFKHWRHYLEGSTHPIAVKRLNQRQARWAQLLAAYDFVIEYKPGRLNVTRCAAETARLRALCRKQICSI